MNLRMCVVSMLPFKYEKALENTISRIPYYIHRKLGIDVIHDEFTANIYKDKRYDILFVRYSPPIWCSYRNIIYDLICTAGKVIYLENDYAYGPEKRVLDLNKDVDYWTTIPSNGKYINWNKMSWLNGISKYLQPIYHGLFYYGTHREGRVDYFEKYFERTLYPVYISTYRSLDVVNFSKYGKTIKFTTAFDSIRQLPSFSLSLYIEDKESHTLYCSPANRFYECLAAGLPMVFDRSCVNTMKTAGYDIGDFVVDHSYDVMKNITNSGKLWAAQRERWYRDYFAEFETEFDALVARELK